MTELVRDCWRTFHGFTATFGAFQLFSFRLLRHIPGALFRPRLISEQIYALGALSLVLITFAGTFVGMVLALQSYATLVEFGSADSMGAFAAEALVRELAPVVAALLFAGRAGSAVASEVGLMRATDQISALEMMAVDPLSRIVAPRVIAGITVVPLLAAIFAAMGILGAYFVAVVLLGIEEGPFWSEIALRVELREDVLSGALKSLVFGVSASLMAVFEGFHALPSAAGISRAATRTVVITSVWILLLDFILTGITLPEL